MILTQVRFGELVPFEEFVEWISFFMDWKTESLLIIADSETIRNDLIFLQYECALKVVFVDLSNWSVDEIVVVVF